MWGVKTVRVEDAPQATTSSESSERVTKQQQPRWRWQRTVTAPNDASKGLANELANKASEAARLRPLSVCVHLVGTAGFEPATP